MTNKKVLFEDLKGTLCALGFAITFRDDCIVFDRNGSLLILPLYLADEEVESRHLFYIRSTLANIGLSINLPTNDAVTAP
jgi:hypothetical protein